MSKSRTLLACAAVLFALLEPAGVSAQDTTVVRFGERVRLRVGGDHVVGLLAATPSPDSIALRTDDGLIAFRTARVLEIERFAGRRSFRMRGALIGGGLGAVFGLIVGAAAGEACSLDPYRADDCSDFTSALGGGLMFGVAGAGLGLLFGLPERDTWDDVPSRWRIE